MLDALSKAFFHTLAGSSALEKLASRYGMSEPDSFGRRFIAGETAGEAIDAARAVQLKGFALTLDLLGESVTNLDEADAATRAYLDVLRQVAEAGVERNLSLKLTQLGLDIDRAVCTDNLRRILGPAGKQGFFVRIDMESSPTVQTTLDIFTTLWQQEYRNVGVVLQSALHRSEDDLARMIALGARVRLVKGAYKEPKSIAYQKKADVDAAYARMTERLLSEGTHPAIATHDPALIEHTRSFARSHAIGTDRFEFQMLFGIRRDLQAELLSQGYRVRVYVPFGRQWFPYFMRRLGERPANVAFLIRGIARERRQALP
jgi:proline dehydrogenase